MVAAVSTVGAGGVREEAGVRRVVVGFVSGVMVVASLVAVVVLALGQDGGSTAVRVSGPAVSGSSMVETVAEDQVAEDQVAEDQVAEVQLVSSVQVAAQRGPSAACVWSVVRLIGWAHAGAAAWIVAALATGGVGAVIGFFAWQGVAAWRTGDVIRNCRR